MTIEAKMHAVIKLISIQLNCSLLLNHRNPNIFPNVSEMDEQHFEIL